MIESNPGAVSNLLKLQAQMNKELLEAGVFNIVTHTCIECTPCLQMCLICALSHKHRHPTHPLRQSLSKPLLQALCKKQHHQSSSLFEQILTLLVTERVRDTVDQEISKLLTTMKQEMRIQVGSSPRQRFK